MDKKRKGIIKIKGWTKEEKFELFEAVKAVGSFDIDKIKEHVPNKSEDEIKFALDVYIKAASSQPTKTTKKREPKLNNPSTPLVKWAKYLVDKHGFEELQTETAHALRLIADCEERPPPECTANVDFRKLYHTLADALEGRPLQKDKYVWAVLDKCVEQTAFTSKALLENSESVKETLSQLNQSGPNAKPFFTQMRKSDELFHHRQLSIQKNFNPLNIPEDDLMLP